jgi:hypothetical protein
MMTTVDKLIDLDLPVLLWGPPGVGKSSMVRAIAERRGWKLIDMRLSQMSPVDLRGIPVPDHQTGRTKWYPPAELPLAERDGDQGILFLDELLQAPRDVQSAALQLVLDRRLGEYELPKGWRIIAASNRVSDQTGSYQIIAALANRFVHIPVGCSLPPLHLDSSESITLDFDAWKKWAYENNVHPNVIGFLSYRPDFLWKATGQVAFATPRTWADYVSKILHHIGPDFTAVAGCIGEGPATEFTAFCNLQDKLPPVQDILDGKEADVPSAPDVLYALSCAIVSALIRLKGKSTLQRAVTNVMRYTLRLPSEFQVLILKDAFGAGLAAHFSKLDDFRTWAAQNRSIVLAA